MSKHTQRHVFRFKIPSSNPKRGIKVVQKCRLLHALNKYGWPEPYIYRYIRCIHGIFGREITIHTVIYGADIRFWPTLEISKHAQRHVFHFMRGSIQVRHTQISKEALSPERPFNLFPVPYLEFCAGNDCNIWPALPSFGFCAWLVESV